jgi:hypothetical protein
VGYASVIVALAAVALMATPFWTPLRGEGWTLDTLEHVVEGHVPGEPVRVTFRLTNRSAEPLRIVGAACC